MIWVMLVLTKTWKTLLITNTVSTVQTLTDLLEVAMQKLVVFVGRELLEASVLLLPDVFERFCSTAAKLSPPKGSKISHIYIYFKQLDCSITASHRIYLSVKKTKSKRISQLVAPMKCTTLKNWEAN